MVSKQTAQGKKNPNASPSKKPSANQTAMQKGAAASKGAAFFKGTPVNKGKGAASSKGTPANKPKGTAPMTVKNGGAKPDAGVIAIAVTLGIVLLCGIVLGIVAIARRPFHFERENIARYMSIDPEAYRTLTLTVKLDEVDDMAVHRQINAVLVKNKSEQPNNNGKGDRTGAIDVGDEVYIWYRGYYLEDGERVEFDGGCNIAVSGITDDDRLLEIGSGGFIRGFEEGLVGLCGNDTSNLVRYTSGTVAATDVVYVTMSAMFPDGTAYENKQVRMDLSDPDLASRYGQTFIDKLVGAEVGSTLGTFTSELAGAPTGLSTATFMDVKVTLRTTGEDRPVTVETRFPATYDKSPDLAGRVAYFEVYISQVVHYDTPDLTDAFITGTLGMKAEELASYDGETLTQRYRSYVREQLLENYEKNKITAIETAMWKKLVELVSVKRIPRRATRMVYEEYLEEFKEDYLYYKDYYGYTSIEQYAADALTLEHGQTYKDNLWQMAESATREKMMFYLVMQTENITPTDAELAACIQAAKDETLDYYLNEVYADDFNRDDYASEAEYQAEVAALWQSILDYYGESYFEESAHYDLVMERLLTYPTVIVE